MKVKIGNKIYDAEEQPIVFILEDSDKCNIGNMSPYHHKNCGFPLGYDKDKAREFMRDIPEKYLPMTIQDSEIRVLQDNLDLEMVVLSDYKKMKARKVVLDKQRKVISKIKRDIKRLKNKKYNG